MGPGSGGGGGRARLAEVVMLGDRAELRSAGR
jgi:hypothetical protein